MTGGAAAPRGARLFPAVVDQVAADTPSRVYAAVPKTANLDHGFRDVTFSELAQAVDALAHQIVRSCGPTSAFDTVTYFGINDLRYPVFWFAAIKAGYKALFMSPRNTLEQNLSLMRQTQCTKVFAAKEMIPLAQQLAQSAVDAAVSTYLIDSFESLVAACDAPFAYTKTYEEAKHDPILVLHSSGSTGDPKPVHATHESFGRADTPLPAVPGRTIGAAELLDYEGGGYFISPFPGFHLAGIGAMAYYPVLTRSAAIVMTPATQPPTPEVIAKIMRMLPIRVLVLPPSIIEALATDESSLELMKKAESVLFAGGPLSQSIGDELVKHVNLTTYYGSTESTFLSGLMPKRREDWSWFCWHPAQNVQMQPDVDNTFELVIKRTPEAEKYQSVFTKGVATGDEWRTKDLFVRHPTEPDLWQFHARKDDILALSNGEKWNPIPSEGVILSHPGVAGVLIVGQGRFEPAALVEPKPDLEQPLTLASIWPKVQEANAAAQTFGRISSTKVAIVPPGSFVRTPKGSVVRAKTAAKLVTVINQLYADKTQELGLQDLKVSLDTDLLRSGQTYEAFLKFTRSALRQVLSAKPGNRFVRDDEDFYSAIGLDSLSTLELARVMSPVLNQEFPAKAPLISHQRVIFQHPTIQKLAEFLYNAVELDQHPNDDGSTPQGFDPVLKKHLRTVQHQDSTKDRASDETRFHVVLTGSTGTLGQHLLLVLANSTKVASVTCLDRNAQAAAASGAAKLAAHRNVDTAYLQAKLDQPGFGLSWAELDRIAQADIVVHNAWKVNFNLSLPSFEPLLLGVTNIIQWAQQLRSKNHGRGPQLAFISSISTMTHAEASPIPELLCSPAGQTAEPSGYAQSKAIAEQLFDASRLTGSILRVGQVAGPAAPTSDAQEELQTVWNPHEWVPLIIRTSKVLGCVPQELPGVVDWIPVNLVAQAIAEIVLGRLINSGHDTNSAEIPPMPVFNLVNPSTRPWSSFVPAVIKAVGSTPPLKAVPLDEWCRSLKGKLELGEGAQGSAEDILDKYPALRALSFFESMAKRKQQAVSWQVAGARAASLTMDQMGPIQDAWLESWIKDWAAQL